MDAGGAAWDPQLGALGALLSVGVCQGWEGLVAGLGTVLGVPRSSPKSYSPGIYCYLLYSGWVRAGFHGPVITP